MQLLKDNKTLFPYHRYHWCGGTCEVDNVRTVTVQKYLFYLTNLLNCQIPSVAKKHLFYNDQGCPESPPHSGKPREGSDNDVCFLFIYFYCICVHFFGLTKISMLTYNFQKCGKTSKITVK